ncbi:MAG: IS1634 family transposase [Bacillota bacterium]
MFIEEVRRPYKGKVYTAVLLRKTYRENGKVKHKTLANLSALPPETIDLIRRSLKGEVLVGANEAFRIMSSRSHGGIWAVLKVAERLGLPRLLKDKLVLAMVIARVLKPGSKRFTAGWWHTTSLPSLLEIPENLSVNTLYESLDSLLKRQPAIERALARRHLSEGSLVLYDLSSTYLEGQCCPLAEYGYNRDGKRGKKQFTYGLLTNEEGCPVSVQAFAGNAADPSTVTSQIEKLKEKFNFKRVVVVGDRGMITRTRIEEFQKAGYDWITALRAKAIQRLHQQGLIQLTLFDEKDLAEIYDPDRLGERLVVCRNPLVAEERCRKREELLQATEAQLAKVKSRVEKGRLKEPEAIALAVGRVIDRWKMAKHFDCAIQHGHFSYQRNEDSIRKEAVLDGVYVVRTSTSDMDAEKVVESYKSLRYVERAFRSMKTMHLELRPVFHRLEDRVRAHTFLCMLAYYVQWHMERDLAPLREENPREYGSLRLALERLQAIQLNTVQVQGQTFQQVTEPDSQQQRILQHLGVKTLV